MTTFRVSSLPDVGGFADGDDAALAWDILKRTASHSVPDTVDLSVCPHLKPYAIACLSGLGLMGRLAGREVDLVMPNDDGCRDHLVRLGLPSWFRCSTAAAPAQRETNLPLKQVTWPPGQAAARIIDMLAPQAALPPGISPRMKESLDEIIMNALTHAESPIECVVVGQAFPKTAKVELAVLDLGQSVRTHLTKNPVHAHVRTDVEAIQLAVQDGITGTPAGQKNRRGIANSGAGLDFVREFCQLGSGELTILSGDAWVTYPAGQAPVTGRLFGSRFQGTLINVRFFTGLPLPKSEIEPIL